MTDTYELTVRTFRMGSDKEAALKPLEEASEVHGAWDIYRSTSEDCSAIVDALTLVDLADEIADCIQACCNLAARYDLNMSEAMSRCERRNRARGRC